MLLNRANYYKDQGISNYFSCCLSFLDWIITTRRDKMNMTEKFFRTRYVSSWWEAQVSFLFQR